MCIAIISTTHPEYSLVLISNRDEYLNRPTARAEWWPPPNDHVFGGRDLLRDVQGTWLGVTKQGRIAVLTNFREEGQPQGVQSRGAMINAFLTRPPSAQSTTDAFVKNLIESGLGQEVGGFSLVCGRIGEPLAVMSNRVFSKDGIAWLAREGGQSVGLSNAAYGDRSWPKIVDGEKLLADNLHKNTQTGESEDMLIQNLLGALSTDTLPRVEVDDGLDTHINQLRNTIFVPAVGRHDIADKPSDDVAAAKSDGKAKILNQQTTQHQLGVSGLYGTQKQTVILARKSGSVRFFERTLYDENSQPVAAGRGDTDVTFDLEK